MGHTNMKLKHHHMKRGPRYRQERRQLKRIGIPMTTVLSTAEFMDLATEVANAYEKMQEPACPICEATGDNPCVTKTGKKAKQNHAARP